MPTLPDLLDAASFVGIAVWRTDAGWCASLERVDGEWSGDARGGTPSAAVAALFPAPLPKLPF